MFAGTHGSTHCQYLMDQFQDLCQLLGVPLSKEKTEGPSTCLSFLGLGIDFVPSDKVVELQEHIMELQDKKTITLNFSLWLAL